MPVVDPNATASTPHRHLRHGRAHPTRPVTAIRRGCERSCRPPICRCARSAFENLSLAILEGMACGTPVLGTPGGGTPELVGAIDPELVLDDDQAHTLADALPGWLADRDAAGTARPARSGAGSRAVRLGARGRRTGGGLQRGRARMEADAGVGGRVGCGYWGPNVIRNLDGDPGFELCCICDADPERLAPVAARYPSARSTTDVDEISRRPDHRRRLPGDTGQHPLRAGQARAERGKHVLVEKPLATTVEQAEELAASPRASG